jgi:hypothetical protein|tara:strand:- start:54 stop:266 length:213 start_codon:yes stop_codon:yes gene_type:complete
VKSVSWDQVLKKRGLLAGKKDYPACICPVTSDGQKRMWLRAWVDGLRAGGHRIPAAVKPLLKRLGVKATK